MILNAPTPVAFGQTSGAIQVDSISFDLTAHTFTVQYHAQGTAPVPGNTKLLQGPIPGALQTALENHVATVVGADTGQAVTVSAP